MYTPLGALHSHAPSMRVGGGVGVYYSRIPVWVSPVWDRVWVTHFLASAMIISHAFAAGGPPSPCSSIYIRLHPQEPTKTHVATHFYHIYTCTIDIQPENRVLVSFLKFGTSQRGWSRRRLSRTGTRGACHGAQYPSAQL